VCFIVAYFMQPLQSFGIGVGPMLYLTHRLSHHSSLLSPVPEIIFGTTVIHAPVSFPMKNFPLLTCVGYYVFVCSVSSACVCFILWFSSLDVRKTSWCCLMLHSSSLMSALVGFSVSSI